MSATKAKTMYDRLVEIDSGLVANLTGLVDDVTIEIDGSDNLAVKALGVDTGQLAADAVTGAKIEDDAVDSEHYAAGSIDNEHLAANSVDSDNYVDGSVDPEHNAERALQPFEIPITDVLAEDGAALGIVEEAGTFNRAIGTNQLFLDGELALNETEASVGWFRFTLPHNYVAAGDVTIRAVVGLFEGAGGTAAAGTCTIDFEAREQGSDATVGSDICATAATAISASFGNKDFTVTPTGLVAGDTVVCKMTTSVAETANDVATLNARITKLQVLCDVQGN